jgi:hypothetical protein
VTEPRPEAVTAATDAAWQAWYEPEHDIARSMATSPYGKMREAFAAGFERGAKAERERIITLASTMRATIPADHPEGARASFADYLRVTAADLVEGDGNG